MTKFMHASGRDDRGVAGGRRLGVGGEGYARDLCVVVEEGQVLPGAVGGFVEERFEGFELAEAELQG